MLEKNNGGKSVEHNELELKERKGRIPNIISPLINRIYKHAKWKYVGILFISFIFLMFGIYPYVIEPQLKDRSNGLEAPDSSQSTTVEELETLMTSYPQGAIDYYLTSYVVFDLIFPLVYMLFFTLAFATLYKGICSMYGRTCTLQLSSGLPSLSLL